MLTAAQRLRNMARGLRNNGKAEQAAKLEAKARELEGGKAPKSGGAKPLGSVSLGSVAPKAKAKVVKAKVAKVKTAKKAVVKAKKVEKKAETKVKNAKKEVTKDKKKLAKAKTPATKKKIKAEIKKDKKKVAKVKKVEKKAQAKRVKAVKKVKTASGAADQARFEATKARAMSARASMDALRARRAAEAKKTAKKAKPKKATKPKATKAKKTKVTKIGTMKLESAPKKASAPKAKKKSASKPSKKATKSGSKPKRSAKQRANDKHLGQMAKARAAGKPAKKKKPAKAKTKKAAKAKKAKKAKAAKAKKPTKAQKKKAAKAKKNAALKPHNLPGRFNYNPKAKKAGKLKSVSTTAGYIDEKGKASKGKKLTKKNSAQARKELGHRKIVKSGRKSLTTRTIYKGEKGERLYVDKHYNYRVNATPEGIKAFVVFGTTVAVGVVAGDVLDRLVATRGPSGSSHGYIGHDATERIMEKPDAYRIGAALGVTTVSFAAAYFLRKRMVLSAAFAGLALGSFVNLGIKLINGYLMPIVLPVATGAETSGRAGLGNRLYGGEQKIPQQALKLQRLKVNDRGLAYDGMAADVSKVDAGGLGSPYLYVNGGFPYAQPVEGVVEQGLVTSTPDGAGSVTLAGDVGLGADVNAPTVDEVYGGCAQCGGIGLSCGCMNRGMEIAKKMAADRKLAEDQALAESIIQEQTVPMNGMDPIQVTEQIVNRANLRLLPSASMFDPFRMMQQAPKPAKVRNNRRR